MELLWDEGTKVCSNGPGHMTKMAVMCIHGKNLKKSYGISVTERPMTLKIWYAASGAQVLPSLFKI